MNGLCLHNSFRWVTKEYCGTFCTLHDSISLYLGRVRHIQRALGVPPIWIVFGKYAMVVICVTIAMQNLLSFNSLLKEKSAKCYWGEAKRPTVTRKQTKDTWLLQPVLCHWGTTTGQQPALIILDTYCTGGTEVPQFHTQQPLSMCRQKSTSGVNQKTILSIKRDSLSVVFFKCLQIFGRPLTEFWQQLIFS